MSNKRKHDEKEEDSKEDHANKKQKLDSDEHEEGEDKKIVELWNKLNNALGPVEFPEVSDADIDGWEKEQRELIQKHDAKANPENYKFPAQYRTYLKFVAKAPKEPTELKVADRQKERECFSGFYKSFVGSYAEKRDLAKDEIETEFENGDLEWPWKFSFLMLISDEAEDGYFGEYYVNCDSKSKDYGAIIRREQNIGDLEKFADSLSEYLELVYNYLTDVLRFGGFGLQNLYSNQQEKGDTKNQRKKEIDTILDDNWKQVKLKQFEKTTVKDVCEALKGQIYIPSSSNLVTINMDDSDKLSLSIGDKDYPIDIDTKDKQCLFYNKSSGYACHANYTEWSALSDANKSKELEALFYIPLEQAREITDGAIDKVELKESSLVFLVNKNEQQS